MTYFTSKLCDDFQNNQAANDNIDRRKSSRFIQETKYWIVVKSASSWRKGHVTIVAKNSSAGLLKQKKVALKEFQRLSRDIARDLQKKYGLPVVAFCAGSEKNKDVARFEILPVQGDFYAACRFLYPDWNSDTNLEKLVSSQNQNMNDYHFMGFFLESYECFCLRAAKEASASFFKRIYEATEISA